MSLQLAWALVHFLWQGLAIAVILLIALQFLREASARYRACAIALALMALAPALTFLYLMPHRTWLEGSRGVILDASAMPPLAPTQASWFEGHASWLITIWLAGACLLLVRAISSWLTARRLITRGLSPLPDGIARSAGRLAASLGVQGVRFHSSRRAASALVFGWLKPVIVLPAAALGRLTEAEIEALLAHELAHVMRQDFIVNLLQTLVECTLFYHPCVWWISARMRHERELCCDDIAVAVCRDEVLYSNALLRLEELRMEPALAATGGCLRDRIRRLLDNPETRRISAVPVVILVLLIAVSVALLAQNPPGPPEPPAPPATPPPAAEATAPVPPISGIPGGVPGGVNGVAPAAGVSGGAPGGSMRAHRQLTEADRRALEEQRAVLEKARHELEAERGNLEKTRHEIEAQRQVLEKARQQLEKILKEQGDKLQSSITPETQKQLEELRRQMDELAKKEWDKAKQESAQAHLESGLATKEADLARQEAALAALSADLARSQAVEARTKAAIDAQTTATIDAQTKAAAAAQANAFGDVQATEAAVKAELMARLAAQEAEARKLDSDRAAATSKEELERRRKYANEKWASQGGAASDKGRAYVHYGPPDEIKTDTGGETWIYKNDSKDKVRMELRFDSNGKRIEVKSVSNTPSATTGAVSMGPGVSAPIPIFKPEPGYSEEAQQAHLEGAVVLSCVIGTDGKPGNIRVVGPLGMGLDEKAVAALEKWTFQPGRKNGQVVPVKANVQVNFRLKNDN